MSYTNGLDNPTLYFNTVLYTGNETDNHAITGVGFQPDFVWAKNRTVAESHNLFDSVRGATKLLIPNTTNAESTQATFLKSFDTDGFTLGTSNNINDSGANLVAWNFLASNTTASNTSGSITSTVSANTTSGFSIVSYTGTGSVSTIGHGLGITPSMMILKSRSNGTLNWLVYHKSIGNTGGVYLDLTNTTDTTAGFWNNTSPTSSVFTIGTGGTPNNSGDNYIAYCFAEKKGFSKFGSYTGNGNADGTFVYTGFKPAFLLIKRTDTTGGWYIIDNKRNTYNPLNLYLQPDSSNGDSTFTFFDFYSNGILCLYDDCSYYYSFTFHHPSLFASLFPDFCLLGRHRQPDVQVLLGPLAYLG